MMELTPNEASKFWPVYNDYDKELSRLGDERLALIRIYADNYGAMTETEKRLDCHQSMHYPVPPYIRGRFLQ